MSYDTDRTVNTPPRDGDYAVTTDLMNHSGVVRSPEDELLLRVQEIGFELREIIVQAKKLPSEPNIEMHESHMRALDVAQTQLQTGMLWLRRAITRQRGF